MRVFGPKASRHRPCTLSGEFIATHEEDPMVTIVTDIRLKKEGAEQQWDAVMRERLDLARSWPGWVGGQLLQPEHDPAKRLIVGTWQSRDDWEKWDEDPEFAHTREELQGLSTDTPQHAWHDVVIDVRHDGASCPPAASRRRRSSRRQSA